MTERFKVVIVGTGFSGLGQAIQLEKAGIRDYVILEKAGEVGGTWHSARWNHEYDLRGKKVAVVGTGASAVQFVPQIAPDVARLTLFQRTPPWIMPKPDHAMPSWARTLFKHVPGTQRAYRNALYW